jgi:transglutaminase-like putative cysteine protease
MKNAAAHPLLPEARLATTRDLVLLCGSLALVVIPHATRAPWWLTLLTACLYAWRIHYSMNSVPLPSRWLVLAVAGIAMLGVWVEYRTIFGRQPGIVLLMLFSGLKVLETRTHRDAAAAAFLGYFLIITNFLYTQSISTALAMALALLAITATLTGFSAPNRAPRANLRTAALLLAHAVPAAAALFLLFPRVQGPLWGLPQDAYSARTGLSETMAPGGISRLVLSDTIAFRAEFEGTAPASQVRYWRGPVLWDFDGRTWSAGAQSLGKFAPPGSGSASYRYSVVLEPHNQSWLFALEVPTSLPEDSRYTADGIVLAAAPVRTRVRYEMSSVIAPRGAPEEQPAQLARALHLPAGVNPRTLALAEELRLASRGDDEILARAIGFLRRGRYAYTLEPPLLGQDSVDEFLFDFKAGFCEHFSSAFVFLMRAAGVPARVVTGYQGGELNPVDRIITVRQSDAHAWAEVHLRGRGWVRVDPTATAAPSRLDAGLARSIRQAEQPLLMQADFEWLRSLRNQWEAAAHKWNVWVLGYNSERQRELMSYVGLRSSDWRALVATLFTVLGILTVLLLAWSLRRVARPDPVQRAWRAFCLKLAARGVERSPSEGPRDYAARAARALPSARRAILRIGDLYIGLRYGRERNPRGMKDLRRLVRELRVA